MAYLLEFELQRFIIRVTVDGELTDAVATELYALVHEFLSSNEVRGGILDLSPVTSLAVTLEAVRRLAKMPPLFKPPQVRVIVAPGDLVFGMARLFQISRSEVHTDLHVVHTLEEAYKIHGLETPNFAVITAEHQDLRKSS